MQAPSFAASRAVALLAAATTFATMSPGALVAQTAYASVDSVQFASVSPLAAHSADNRAAPTGQPIWRGTVIAPRKGNVTLTLERIGIPESAIEPSWPITARWSYEALDPSKSFTAQLFGSGEANGKMALHGVITSGYGAGREVDVQVHGGSSNRAVMSYGPGDQTP